MLHSYFVQKAFMELATPDDDFTMRNQRGMEVKVTGSTLQTLEHVLKVLEYLYKDDMKFVPDYRYCTIAVCLEISIFEKCITCTSVESKNITNEKLSTKPVIKLFVYICHSHKCHSTVSRNNF